MFLRVAERVAEKGGRAASAGRAQLCSRCHGQQRTGHDPPDGMASQSPPARAPVGTSLLDLLGLRIRRSGEQPTSVLFALFTLHWYV